VRPSQEGIVQHFQSIAGVTALPLMLYDIPARTGVGMELETIVRLAADPQFIALKQCGGGLAFTAELLQAGQLKILCGDDAALFCSLCLGAHGAISAAAHIRPDLYVRLFHLVQGGQLEQAGRLFAALLPMIRLLFSEPNPGPVKAALAQLGLLHDELRLPMMSMSTAGQTRLAAVLEQVMALPHESAYAGDKASQSSLNFLPPRAIWELA
jgi:4-hydroxy-tetrahydrodipicolinate synthase